MNCLVYFSKYDNRNKISTVSFDVLGTLLCYFPSREKVYSDICKNYNIIYSENEFKSALSVISEIFDKEIEQKISHPSSYQLELELWGEFNQNVLNYLGFSEGEELGKLIHKELWENPKYLKVERGAHETLTALKNNGYKLITISNEVSSLRNILKLFGLYDFFDEIFISSEVGFSKPDRRIFEYAMKKLAISNDEIIHIGDSLVSDVLGAKRANIKAIHLNKNNKRCNDNHLDIHGLEEVLNFLI